MSNPTVGATNIVAIPDLTNQTVAASYTASPPIPFGCICAYTWGIDNRVMRNGALAGCPADHTAVDRGF